MVSQSELNASRSTKEQRKSIDLGVQRQSRPHSPVPRALTPQPWNARPVVPPKPPARSLSPAPRSAGRSRSPTPRLPRRSLSPAPPQLPVQPRSPAAASPPNKSYSPTTSRPPWRSLTPSPLPYGHPPFALPSSPNGLHLANPAIDRRRKQLAASPADVQQAEYHRKYSLPTPQIKQSSQEFEDEHIYAVPLNSDGQPFSDCSDTDSDESDSYIEMTPIPPLRKESLEIPGHQTMSAPRKQSLDLTLTSAHQQFTPLTVGRRKRAQTEIAWPEYPSLSQLLSPNSQNSSSPENELHSMIGTTNEISVTDQQRQEAKQLTKSNLLLLDWSPTYVDISSTAMDGLPNHDSACGGSTERIHSSRGSKPIASPQAKPKHPPRAPLTPQNNGAIQQDTSSSLDKTSDRSKLCLTRKGSSSVPNLSNKVTDDDESAQQELKRSKNLAYSNGNIFSAHDPRVALSMDSPILHCTSSSSSSSISSTNSSSWGSINQAGSAERSKPVSTLSSCMA